MLRAEKLEMVRSHQTELAEIGTVKDRLEQQVEMLNREIEEQKERIQQLNTENSLLTENLGSQSHSPDSANPELLKMFEQDLREKTAIISEQQARIDQLELERAAFEKKCL